jgi:hypothetical protein
MFFTLPKPTFLVLSTALLTTNNISILTCGPGFHGEISKKTGTLGVSLLLTEGKRVPGRRILTGLDSGNVLASRTRGQRGLDAGNVLASRTRGQRNHNGQQIGTANGQARVEGPVDEAANDANAHMNDNVPTRNRSVRRRRPFSRSFYSAQRAQEKGVQEAGGRKDLLDFNLPIRMNDRMSEQVEPDAGNGLLDSPGNDGSPHASSQQVEHDAESLLHRRSPHVL